MTGVTRAVEISAGVVGAIDVVEIGTRVSL